MSADYKDLEEFKRKAEQLEDNKDEFMRACCKELAQRLIAKASKKTPVDTGTLRRGWTAGKNSSVANYVDSLEVTKTGDKYTIVVCNPTEYASYVEYGHRTGKSGWCKGKFMLTTSVNEIENTKVQILEKKLEKWLKEAMK